MSSQHDDGRDLSSPTPADSAAPGPEPAPMAPAVEPQLQPQGAAVMTGPELHPEPVPVTTEAEPLAATGEPQLQPEPTPATDEAQPTAATSEPRSEPEPAAPEPEAPEPAAPEPEAQAGTTELEPEQETGREQPAALGERGYSPPPSPAYAPPPPPRAVSYARAAPAAQPAQPAEPTDADRSTERGWQLLLVGLALVVLAAAVVVSVIVSGGGAKDHAFGEVTAASGGAVVQSGSSQETRPLEAGETVLAGWTIETPGAATVTVQLAEGGIARFDSGAKLAFVDLAVDPETGDRAGESEPAIQARGGRVWINLGNAEAAASVEVRIPDGVVESAGNPVALDCTSTCNLEAPAGGVVVTTGAGTELAPGADEVVTLVASETFDLTVRDAPSDWARQNLDADSEVGLSEPRPDDGPSITDSAILDGTYAIALDVVGPPAGDAIPTELQYSAGETYELEVTTDGRACFPGSCSVPASAADGASGTAEVAAGSVELTIAQPIDCYDETYTTVVVPDIGTTTVTATLAVGDVEFDGERWLVRSFDGTGSVAATLATPCNTGDTLGTSASQITIAGDRPT